MRLVPIQCVKENSYLGRDLYDDNGKILLREGAVLTASILKKIESLQIYTIYITDEYSKDVFESVIKPEIRQKAIKIVRQKFNSLEKGIKGHDISYNESEKEFEAIACTAKELIEEILLNKDIILCLVDIKSFSNYTFQHSVNVAVISLLIGMKISLHKFDLIDLCVGAMLHDIGKVFIPKEILEKSSELTKEEFHILKQHTTKGYEYLRESNNIAITSTLVALQHHEKISGQGFPEERSGEKISKFAKIVAIADVYDTLTSEQYYRRAISPNEAFEYIMANGGIKFDYEFVQVFLKIVVPYAVGTLVKLSTGEIGLVSKINKDMPLRPEVKIIHSNKDNNINKYVNLVDNIGIVIKGVQYEVPEGNEVG